MHDKIVEKRLQTVYNIRTIEQITRSLKLLLHKLTRKSPKNCG